MLDGLLEYPFRKVHGTGSDFRYTLACKTGWDFSGRDSHRKMLFQGSQHTNLPTQIALPRVVFPLAGSTYACQYVKADWSFSKAIKVIQGRNPWLLSLETMGKRIEFFLSVGPEKKGVSKRMNQNAELHRRVDRQERRDVKPDKYTFSFRIRGFACVDSPQCTCPLLEISNDIASSDLHSAAALRNKWRSGR